MMKRTKIIGGIELLLVLMGCSQPAAVSAPSASAISGNTYTFTSLADGKAYAGDWKLDSDGTISQSSTSNSFPLLVFNAPVFKDFDYATEFKIESGVEDQYAALTFRIVDEKNYYAVRASASEQSVTFARFDNGSRSVLKTWPATVKLVEWQALRVSVRGAETTILLNGAEVGKISDERLTSGKVGLGTKADSVARFRKVVVLAK